MTGRLATRFVCAMGVATHVETRAQTFKHQGGFAVESRVISTAPSTGPPPQGAPQTSCVTGPAGMSLTTPPSWIPVTVCQFSALCICTLLLMLIILALQLTAHASLLSSSLLMHLPPLKAFTCFSCTCSTSRSMLPDAYTDTLHNSQGLLFHPRAVTPLGSSPRTRFCCRCVRALEAPASAARRTNTQTRATSPN
jgi:hypothetical protein